MKTSGIIAAILMGTVALIATVWIGRYQGQVPTVKPNVVVDKSVDVGPPVSPTGPHPKAVTTETDHDFGTMSRGQKGSHVFTIKNDGAAPLVLMARKEDTTCQCTFGELKDNDSIPPGGSTEVTVNWEIKALVPEFRHKATVRTNDPDRRTIELVVGGKVEQLYQFSPATPWDFGEVPIGHPGKMVAEISSKVWTELPIIGFTSTSSHLSATWEPMSEEDRQKSGVKCGQKITLILAAEAPAGLINETVSFTTGIEEAKEISVGVKCQRPGPIELVGPAYRKELNAVTLGGFTAADGKEVTVSLFVRDLEGDLQLLDVTPSLERVTMTLEKDVKFTGKTQRYLLKIRVLPGAPLNHTLEQALKVELRLNHPRYERMPFLLQFLAN